MTTCELTDEEKAALESPMWPSYQWKKFLAWISGWVRHLTGRPEAAPLYDR